MTEPKIDLNKEYWGAAEIAAHRKITVGRAYQMIREKTFPLPAFILGERTNVWSRTTIIKFFKEKADA